jgi:DNA replication regulator SLD3
LVNPGNDALAQISTSRRALRQRRVSRQSTISPATPNPTQHSSTPPCAASMSTYALQTKTMLHSASTSSIQLFGAASHDGSKPQLPSKRRREAICGLGASHKPFTIKPHPESPYQKPATFKPVRVIGRSQLPLTFLDTTTDDSFVANSLFSAHIDVLENDDGLGETAKNTAKVLIARYDSIRTLYAIERVQARVYSICKLASWIKEKDVAELWNPEILQAHPSMSGVDMSSAGTGDWWQNAAVEARPTPPSKPG